MQIGRAFEAHESPVPVERNSCSSSGSEEANDDVANADAVDAMEVVVDFLTKMILTDEKYLRATPAHQVIRCAGHGLRQGPGTEASFVHSTSMKTINKFISHSWQASTGLKILTLQMFFNGKVAVLVGNLAALLGTALFSFGLLPGFEKVPRFTTEPILVAPWSLSAGVLSSLLMWIFWPPKEKVFLDRLCINQADPYEKTQGVLNIGACLKNSKSLLVILDDTYCGRLWCQFELAAFLKTHEDQDLVIQPMSLTFFILSLYFGNILLWYGSILVPFDSLFNTPIFAVGLCIHGWIIATAILWYMKEVDTVKSQLQGFSFAEASCWCCSVDHKGKAGERIPCDREIMQQCIQRWFGSTEQFEKSVQTRVKDALSLRLGGNFCTYPQLLAASLPALWANMDYTASRILSRDAKGAFSIVMSGACATLINPAFVVGLIIISIWYTPPAYPRCQKVLASIVSMGSVLFLQGFVQICIDSFELVLASTIYSAVFLLLSAPIWWLARGLFRP